MDYEQQCTFPRGYFTNSFYDYTLLFLRALALTVLFETVVLITFFVLRKWKKRSQRLVIRVLVAGVVASCLTLPFVWFVFPAIIQNRTLFLVVSEIFAFVAEVPIIRRTIKTTRPEAIAASFLANSVSFTSGILLRIS